MALKTTISGFFLLLSFGEAFSSFINFVPSGINKTLIEAQCVSCFQNETTPTQFIKILSNPDFELRYLCVPLKSRLPYSIGWISDIVCSYQECVGFTENPLKVSFSQDIGCG